MLETTLYQQKYAVFLIFKRHGLTPHTSPLGAPLAEKRSIRLPSQPFYLKVQAEKTNSGFLKTF